MKILQGDCRDILPTLSAASVQCCVTSPPYWGLRDYGCNGQLGLEATPEEYIAKMVGVFREVSRVLRDDSTLWLNIGDSYASSGTSGYQRLDELGERLGCGGGHKHSSQLSGRAPTPPGLKPKDLCGIPWRLAFALQADGWYLRSDIIWHKPNPMPESVTDRPTKSHEYIFLLTKRASYFYDADAIREPANRPEGPGNITPMYVPGERNGNNANIRGSLHKIGPLDVRNKRTVWTVATSPFSDAHFATFPPDLIKPCILAGSRVGDAVLDPFAGSGTVGLVATEYGRKSVLIELNPMYVAMIRDRTNVTIGML